MPSLQHVCMWSDSGWKSITAQEAANIHPGGGVSAGSGLFMCKLCGQYVTLTKGGLNVSHFRHRSDEADKSCPERTFGSSDHYSFDVRKFELPIRICNVSLYSFDFELGLIKVPDEKLSDYFFIEIKTDGNKMCCKYSSERLNNKGTTYLPIGNVLQKEYILSYPNDRKLSDYWPKKVTGAEPKGTFFDKGSGIKLPCDSDVEVGKEYYMLTNVVIHEVSGLRTKEICHKRVGYEMLHLYSVCADKFNENTVSFFIDHRCRLTLSPVSIHQIWPPYSLGNYVLKCGSDSIYAVLNGMTTGLKTFPDSKVQEFGIVEDKNVFIISIKERQQLIATGRCNVLKYMYLWRETADEKHYTPLFNADDLNGDPIAEGENDKLPSGGIIRVCTEYDGEVVVIVNGVVSEKIGLSAQISQNIDHITYRTQILLKVGMDIVWSCKFECSKDHSNDINEEKLLNSLRKADTKMISAPHALLNIALKFKRYPGVYRWIVQSVKNGMISERSYRELQRLYLEINR